MPVIIANPGASVVYSAVFEHAGHPLYDLDQPTGVLPAAGQVRLSITAHAVPMNLVATDGRGDVFTDGLDDTLIVTVASQTIRVPLHQTATGGGFRILSDVGAMFGGSAHEPGFHVDPASLVLAGTGDSYNYFDVSYDSYDRCGAGDPPCGYLFGLYSSQCQGGYCVGPSFPATVATIPASTDPSICYTAVASFTLATP